MRLKPGGARTSNTRITVVLIALFVTIAGTGFLTLRKATAEPRSAAHAARDLRTVVSFASIRDRTARSQALFVEAGRVIQHPRCINCHPAGEQLRQGDVEPHLPGVVRGDDGFGAPGLRCNTCHQAENYEPSGVPGHPKWHVAPRELTWEGRSLAQICEQIKDPKRNGGMNLEQLHEHMAHDTLVGWGWHPGAAREPVPGTQQSFGAIIRAWIDDGAACPK